MAATLSAATRIYGVDQSELDADNILNQFYYWEDYNPKELISHINGASRAVQDQPTIAKVQTELAPMETIIDDLEQAVKQKQWREIIQRFKGDNTLKPFHIFAWCDEFKQLVPVFINNSERVTRLQAVEQVLSDNEATNRDIIAVIESYTQLEELESYPYYIISQQCRITLREFEKDIADLTESIEAHISRFYCEQLLSVLMQPNLQISELEAAGLLTPWLETHGYEQIELTYRSRLKELIARVNLLIGELNLLAEEDHKQDKITIFSTDISLQLIVDEVLFARDLAWQLSQTYLNTLESERSFKVSTDVMAALSLLFPDNEILEERYQDIRAQYSRQERIVQSIRMKISTKQLRQARKEYMEYTSLLHVVEKDEFDAVLSNVKEVPKKHIVVLGGFVLAITLAIFYQDILRLF